VNDNLVEVRDLTVRSPRRRAGHGAHGVDFSVAAGEVMTILGESGSGKSVTLQR